MGISQRQWEKGPPCRIGLVEMSRWEKAQHSCRRIGMSLCLHHGEEVLEEKEGKDVKQRGRLESDCEGHYIPFHEDSILADRKHGN